MCPVAKVIHISDISCVVTRMCTATRKYCTSYYNYYKQESLIYTRCPIGREYHSPMNDNRVQIILHGSAITIRAAAVWGHVQTDREGQLAGILWMKRSREAYFG